MQPELHREITQVLSKLSEPSEIEILLRDLLTPSEVEALTERWAIVRALDAGDTQRKVSEALGVSITTVSRGSRSLKYGLGGFRRAFDSLGKH